MYDITMPHLHCCITGQSPSAFVDISRCNMMLYRHLRPKENVNLQVLAKHTIGFRLLKVMWSSDSVIMPSINKNHLIAKYSNISTGSSLKAQHECAFTKVTEISLKICSGFGDLTSPLL